MHCNLRPPVMPVVGCLHPFNKLCVSYLLIYFAYCGKSPELARLAHPSKMLGLSSPYASSINAVRSRVHGPDYTNLGRTEANHRYIMLLLISATLLCFYTSLTRAAQRQIRSKIGAKFSTSRPV